MPGYIYGPYDNAPGGNTLSVVGPPAAFTGGQNWTYSGFDTTMYSDIWWAPFDIHAAMDGAVDAPGETLTFDSIVGGTTAIWTGQTTMPLFDGSSVTIYTRFVAEITGASGTATWVMPTVPDPDITAVTGPLVDIDESVNSFEVNLEFEASYTGLAGTFINYLDLYDAAETPPGNPPGTSGPALSGFHYGLFVQEDDTVDSPPVVTGADPTIAYTEADPAIALAPNATLFDAELSGLNGGLGDFSGASIGLSGIGGDNQIRFLTSTLFESIDGVGLVEIATGNTFATFALIDGLPALVFTNANGTTPTTELVNEVIQHLGYFNEARTPNATETIGMIFRDGTGNQTPISIDINITDIPNGDGIISDFVWHDGNQDGIQDPWETGLSGIVMNLAASGDPGTTIATATTDADGLYSFDGLFAGDYLVSVDASTIPTDFAVTTANAGADDALDSDFATSASQVSVTLATDTSVVTDVDLGLYDSTNVAPVASDTSDTTNEDQGLNGTASATDANGDTLTYALVSDVLHGTLSLGSDGSYSYVPDLNFNGSDSFTFNVSDGGLISNTATVSITVNPLNDVPVLADMSFSVDEDGVFNGTFPVAVDPDGDPQEYQYDFGAEHGTVVSNTDGTFTYTPDPDYFGPDTFRYSSTDGTQRSNLATATVTVNPVNDAPGFTGGTQVFFLGGTYGLNSSNFLQAIDPDNTAEELTFTLVTVPQYGVISLDGTELGANDQFTQADIDSGLLSFTLMAMPVGGAGVDEIIVQVSDGELSSGLGYHRGFNLNAPPPTEFDDTILGTRADDAIDLLAGNDTYEGIEGNDTILGGSGNDLLIGGVGADRMMGGTGDDTYGVGDVGDQVIEGPGEGIDEVQSSMNFDLLLRAPNVENLTLTGSADTNGYGDNGANVLTGNSGNNSLYGRGGNDTMFGAGGMDIMVGGLGDDRLIGGIGTEVLDGSPGDSDTLDYSGATAQVIVRLWNNTVSGDPIAAGDTILNFENAETGSGGDVIAGNFQDNILTGNGGNDSLFGYDGADILIGGAGLDLLDGGLGNDSLLGGLDADILRGAAGNDTMDGGDGADVLIGGVGDDRLIGNTGAETLDGSPGDSDTLDYSNATGAVTVRIWSNSVSGDPVASGDTIRNFENAEGGAGNDLLAGNFQDNILTGNGGDDSLYSYAGSDILRGGAGNDILRGGAGNDELSGGLDRDFLTGGADADTFLFGSAAEAGLGALRDQIIDFQTGLDVIDASAMAPGSFDFRGTAGFTNSGVAELRLFETPSGSTIVQFDVDGDGAIDAEVRVANVTGLTATDFVL